MLRPLRRLLPPVRAEQASEGHHVPVVTQHPQLRARICKATTFPFPRPTLVRSARTQNRKHSQSKHNPRGCVPLGSPHILPVQTSVPDSTSVRTWSRYSPYRMSPTLFSIVALSQTQGILQRNRLVAGNSICNSTHQDEGERHNLDRIAALKEESNTQFAVKIWEVIVSTLGRTKGVPSYTKLCIRCYTRIQSRVLKSRERRPSSPGFRTSRAIPGWQ